MARAIQILAAESPAADSTFTVLLGGIFVLAGGLVGIGGTLAAELLRARNAERSEQRKELRSASADFSGSLVRMSHLAWVLSQRPNDSVILERLAELNEEGRASFERLRLLSDSWELQEAGRLALRHVSRYGKSPPASLTRVPRSFRRSRRVNDSNSIWSASTSRRAENSVCRTRHGLLRAVDIVDADDGRHADKALLMELSVKESSVEAATGGEG